MSRLSFFRWGIRPFNILLFMAYPTMGAVFAMPDLKASTLLRLCFFCLFNLPFIAHVYILNDWSDAKLIPNEPGLRDKHAMKHPELVSERDVLYIAGILAAVGLAGFLVLDLKIFLLGILLAGITFFYSHPGLTLKRRPLGASLAHFVGAGMYFLTGWILFSRVNDSAIWMALFFGMVIVAGNYYNEIEDFNQDLDAGLRTTALAYGQRPVFRTGLLLFTSSSLLFVILSLAGAIHFHLVWPGLALLLFWVAMAIKYRGWKGGESSRSVRLSGRVAYGFFCFAVIAILIINKL